MRSLKIGDRMENVIVGVVTKKGSGCSRLCIHGCNKDHGLLAHIRRKGTSDSKFIP
jgi:hypothetical protein